MSEYILVGRTTQDRQELETHKVRQGRQAEMGCCNTYIMWKIVERHITEKGSVSNEIYIFKIHMHTCTAWLDRRVLVKTFPKQTHIKISLLTNVKI